MRRLIDVAPELVDELDRLLSRAGEHALAMKIADLDIVETCGCGDDFCGSFYTRSPNGPYGVGHRTLSLTMDDGYLIIDVVKADIVYVEMLYRDALKAKIYAAVPPVQPL
jgi:hypothetical protein